MTLSEELRAVEAEFPLWHLYLSKPAAEIWAVTIAHSWGGGGGHTLTAPTPDLMRHAIATEEWSWQLAPGPVYDKPVSAAGGW